MDGVRPFNYQPLTRGLLAQSHDATVQPLSSNIVTQTTLPYSADRSSIFDTGMGVMDSHHSINPSLPQNTTLEKKASSERRDHFTHEDVTDNRQTQNQLRKENTEQNIKPQHSQEDMSLLSWLEQAQTRFPVMMTDEDVPVLNSSIDSCLQKNNNNANRSRNDELQNLESLQTKPGKNNNSATVLPMPDINDSSHQIVNNNNEKSNKTAKKITTTLPAVNIDLPNKTKGKVQQDQELTKRSMNFNDVTKDTQQNNVSRKTNSSQSSSKTESLKFISNNKAVNTSKNDNVTLENTKGQHKGIKKPHLESKAVFKHTSPSQLNKIQHALQVQKLNPVQPSSSKQRSERTEERKIENKVNPQLPQQVVVINPPMVGSSSQHAFLERSYLGRLGPRSYK